MNGEEWARGLRCGDLVCEGDTVVPDATDGDEVSPYTIVADPEVDCCSWEGVVVNDVSALGE